MSKFSQVWRLPAATFSAVLLIAGLTGQAQALVTFVNPQTTLIDPSNSTLVGDAFVGGEVTLTNNGGQSGAMWFATPVGVQKFSATFEARISSGSGSLGHGTGFSFTVQNSPAGTGAQGAHFEQGYGAISNSAAVIFDTFGINEIGVGIGGAAISLSAVTYSVGPLPALEFENGNWRSYRIDYDAAGTELGVFVDGLYMLQADVDLTATLGGSSGYIGLTAGTDSIFFSEHEFRNFELTTEQASVAVSSPGGLLIVFFGLAWIVFRRR